jgi:hypothetical protein
MSHRQIASGLLMLAFLAGFLPLAPAAAQKPGARDVVEAVLSKDGPDYIRFHRGKKRSSLDTRVTRFRTEDAKLEIALFAAVHIADASYYENLQKKLKGFELVLYEGVAMKKGDEPDEVLTALGRLQQDLGAALGLTHQKAAITLKGEQFRRADLNSAEIKAELAKREIGLVPGGEMLALFGPLLRRSLKLLAPTKDEEEGGFKAAMRRRAKLSIARVLADGEGLYAKMKGDEGKKRDEVIIGARNARAMKALDEALKAQPAPKKIAILYGAAHMADFESRLRTKFPGLRETGTEWVEAWAMGEAAASGPADAKKSGETEKAESKPTRRDL